jgi:hypothetical protein
MCNRRIIKIHPSEQSKGKQGQLLTWTGRNRPSPHASSPEGRRTGASTGRYFDVGWCCCGGRKSGGAREAPRVSGTTAGAVAGSKRGSRCGREDEESVPARLRLPDGRRYAAGVGHWGSTWGLVTGFGCLGNGIGCFSLEVTCTVSLTPHFSSST